MLAGLLVPVVVLANVGPAQLTSSPTLCCCGGSSRSSTVLLSVGPLVDLIFPGSVDATASSGVSRTTSLEPPDAFWHAAVLIRTWRLVAGLPIVAVRMKSSD